ncbi:MAG: class I SAM-dependent methyltransferase [Proteobacteria bacterium]|nr:class I SAM-dependent methyltransferase [Pseudomonadota bacterium]
MPVNLGITTDVEALRGLVDWNGKQVLDVGCGPGALGRDLAGLGATVRGFEPDPVQAEKNRAAEAVDGVTLAEAPAQDLPVESSSVDVVVLSRSLHHVPADAMDDALAEARRVLKDDGVLLILEPDIHGQFSQLIRPFHDETVCRAQALQALDRQAERFTTMDELWYTTEFRAESFDAFKDRMVGMSFNDIVAETIEQPEVAAAFEAGRVQDGYRFTNPMRIRVYRTLA